MNSDHTPMNLYVGTSGFAYRAWRGGFYPNDLRPAAMLSYYAQKLTAVEINATFYRIPRTETVAKWADEVPQEFRFAFKAPAAITHQRRLGNAGELLARFLEVTGVLGHRRGPILFQLPPWFQADIPLLEQFVSQLRDVRTAFEFRHPSWFHDEVYALLREAGCALCISDREEAPPPAVVTTASFGYLRLRHPHYSPAELQNWLSVAEKEKWREVYVFFRHEETGRGTTYARGLLDVSGSR